MKRFLTYYKKTILIYLFVVVCIIAAISIPIIVTKNKNNNHGGGGNNSGGNNYIEYNAKIQFGINPPPLKTDIYSTNKKITYPCLEIPDGSQTGSYDYDIDLLAYVRGDSRNISEPSSQYSGWLDLINESPYVTNGFNFDIKQQVQWSDLHFSSAVGHWSNDTSEFRINIMGIPIDSYYDSNYPGPHQFIYLYFIYLNDPKYDVSGMKIIYLLISPSPRSTDDKFSIHQQNLPSDDSSELNYSVFLKCSKDIESQFYGGNFVFGYKKR